MKRMLASAALAALLVAGTGSEVQGQELGRRASLFDLGLYAGFAHSTSWADVNDEGYGIGSNPVFGAQATFWANPYVGVRTHLAYIPSGFGPDDTRPSFFETDGLRSVNNYLLDLSVVLRPFFTNPNMNNLLASTYFFLGGGAVASNPAGETGCLPGGLLNAGGCLSRDWEQSTVGQGTAGIGWDLIPITPNVGIFAELGLHGYDSPVHVGTGWTGRPEVAEDKFALTTRLVAGLKFSFGDIMPAPIAPPVEPAPPPPPPPAPMATPIQVCVIEGNEIRLVDASVMNGDTTVMVAGAQQRFAQAYPANTPSYAASATWYVNNERITVGGRQYDRFGLTRIITPPSQLTRVGEFQGTPVFAEAGAATPPSMLYVPVRTGCEFQPYQEYREVRRVRG